MENTIVNIRHRPELERFQVYQPGLSIPEIERRYGLKNVIKLASNENPLGPSPKARAAYRKFEKGIFRYPESQSRDLRRMVALRHGVQESEVIIGAGSDEVIELLAKAYLTPEDEIIISASAFPQYRAAGDLMGARVVTVPMERLTHDLKSMASLATSRTKFIFIANPNNPTGTYNTRAQVDSFLAQLPAHVVPVFDEAYFEYASVKPDYPSMIKEFFHKRPLIILRTFSKAYGLAGLRVGFGVAPSWCVATLDKIRPPFNVSVSAQAAALAALDDKAHLKKTVSLNEREKKRVSDALVKMGFDVVPSAANFLLFKVSPRTTGRSLFEALLKKGVIARSVDEYGLKDYLRVSIGKPRENKIFLKALMEVFKTK